MYEVRRGDCLAVMREMPDNSVDSVVTDPPYHLTSIVKRYGKTSLDGEGTNERRAKGRTDALARLSRGFMGKEWDGGDVAFQVETWEAVYRVLKPGGHLVAFSGTRTYHRMASAIEAAGFEVRDMLSWNFGSGFPKSHNITKALAASGLACSCPKTIVSHHHVSRENLRDLQAGLAAHDALPIDAQSDLRAEVLGTSDRHEAGSATPESAALIPMRDMRNFGSPSAFTSKAGSEDLLQRVMPVENVCGSPAADGGEHEGAEPRAAIRGKEPGLEGRGLPQAAERELQGRPLCASARVGATDGEEGRLHHGASARDGADVRVSPYQDGSGQPHRPQALEQPSEQPRAVADKCGSQAWGGWPVCPGCSKPIIPEGYGTALKPAHEPICLARKPLSEKSVAANVLRWGTGALNIDESRVPFAGEDDEKESKTKNQHADFGSGPMTNKVFGKFDKDRDNYDPPGRWPANLIHDGSDEVLPLFPSTNGGDKRGKCNGSRPGGFVNIGAEAGSAEPCGQTYADSGSAARFFYCAKASKKDRNYGLDGEESTHPTVKPTDLMRYLCRLVTPRRGIVLDPFAGSGSTGLGALLGDFDFIGIEKDDSYAAIAERRIGALSTELGLDYV